MLVEREAVTHFAELCHKGTFRYDGTTPSIVHPKRVASKFSSDFEWSVAMLHDVLEDSSYTYEDMLRFGIDPEVCILVKLLTRTSEEPYFDYIMRIIKHGGVAVKIKIADIEDNLNDSPSKTKRDLYKFALILLRNTSSFEYQVRLQACIDKLRKVPAYYETYSSADGTPITVKRKTEITTEVLADVLECFLQP